MLAGKPQELISPDDGSIMLRNAIKLTLEAPTNKRTEIFEQFVAYIQQNAIYEDTNKSWTCHLHTGTDGSRIFRGGIGFSLVIDPQGRLWRAATLEDFETTYTITPVSCEIATMTPIYTNMREYISEYYIDLY